MASSISDPFKLLVWSGPFRRRQGSFVRKEGRIDLPCYRPSFIASEVDQQLALPAQDLWVYAIPVLADDQHNAQSGDGQAFEPDKRVLEIRLEPSGKLQVGAVAQGGVTFMSPVVDVLPGLLKTIDLAGRQTNVMWCFVGSPVKLGAARVKKLHDWPAWRLLPVRLKGKSPAEAGNTDAGAHLIQHAQHGLVAGVLDLSRIGPGLNAVYQRARRALIDKTRPNADQTEAARNATIRELKQKTLAELLQQVLDQGDKPELKKRLRSEGKAVKGFLDDLARQVQRLTQDQEETAGACCEWMAGYLYQEVLFPAYEEARATDLLLTNWAETIDAIFTSRVGRALLFRHAADEKHPLYTYVFLSGPASEDLFKSVQKCAPASMALIMEYANPLVALAHSKAATPAMKQRDLSYIAGAAKFLTRQDLFKVEIIESGKFRNVFTTGGFKNVTSFKLERLEPTPVANWVKWVHGAEPIVHRTVAALEVLNFYVALNTLSKAEPGLATFKEWVSVVSSLSTTTAAFAAMRGAAKPSKVAGALGAVLDIYCSSVDAYQASKKVDYVAVEGNVIAAVGSAFIAAGCISQFLGVGAGATFVGLPLAVLFEVAGAIAVGIGTLIVVFGGSSDFQTFAAACDFGDATASDLANTNFFPWARGTLKNLRDDIDSQIAAFFAFTAGFQFVPGGASHFRLYYGLVRPASVLRLELHAEQRDDGPDKQLDTIDVKLEVDFENKTCRQIGGATANAPFSTRFEKDDDGRPFVEIKAPFARVVQKKLVDTGELVRAELFLDGPQQAPIPPQPMKGRFWDSGTAPRTEVTLESRNF